MSFYSQTSDFLDSAVSSKDSVKIAVASRDAVRATIKFLFGKKNAEFDEKETLLGHIHSRIVEEFVSVPEKIAALDFVRMLGSNADHGIHVKRTQSAKAVQTARDFAALVGAAFEPGSVTAPETTPELTEAETRKLYIDTYLEEAGWEVSTVKGALVPGGAGIEYKVEGMPPNGQDGYCDYVLFGDDGKPLAVVEAKKTSESEEKGRTQVIRYGECLEKRFHVKPILYYTNGYRIQCLDRVYSEPRRLVAFHTKKELERLMALQKRGKIGDMKPNPDIAGRPYQTTAITSMCEHFDGKHRKGLVVLATGTGKTRVAIALVDVLTRHNWVENVLFLADRRELVKQAHKWFAKLLPNMTYSVLSDEKLKGSEDARIMFSTHQTMIRYIDAADKKFKPGRFDLIIIDEAHRSIFNKYGAIFRYFDSLLVGLTATPKQDVDANTYRLFDREVGKPNYSYSIDEAVEHHWLVDWDLKNRTTDVMRSGITYDELSEEEREQADEEFVKAGYSEVPEHVSSSKIFKAVFNETTCDKVLQDLMTNGYKLADNETLGKTIIFAANHPHAEMIVSRFKKLYPQYPEEYCQLIDNYVKFSDTLIDDFKEKPAFRIAVSVDMLDTGVDVPEILNLVFFKKVRSKIKFIQMVGRGTRTCDDLFGLDSHKKKFRAFDWCGNFEYFGMGGKGSDDGPIPKSLTQTIFEARVHLALLLQPVEQQQIEWRKVYHDEIVAELLAAAKLLKTRIERIQVRENLPHIDRFQTAAVWNVLSPVSEAEVDSFIAPLVESSEGNELIKMFDARMLRVEVPLVGGNDAEMAKGDVASVRKTAKALMTFGTIPEVMARAKELKRLASDELWGNPTLEEIEELRRAIRPLLPYLKGEKKAIVTLNISDKVEELPDWGWKVDIKTYREKVIDYLQKHSESPVVAKIRQMKKLTPEDMNEIEKVCFEELGTKEEFNEENKDNEGRSLAGFLRSLTGLDQDAVNALFGEFLQGGNLNADQQMFVSEIIDYIRANGEITFGILQTETPFSDFELDELFKDNMGEWQKLVSRINDILPLAV